MNSIADILDEELERAKQLIIAHIRANGQNASGKTIASMHVEVDEGGGTIYGRSPFGTLETGRRGGRVPYNFRSIIRQWMKDKGIKAAPIPYVRAGEHKYTPEERGEMSLAGAIAHRIAKSGTQLYRLGGRDDVYSNVIPEAVKRIKARLLELAAVEASSIKLNNQTIK